MILNKTYLVQGLTTLGVKPGMVLCVHSSLSALGKVEGGAQSLIEALMEAVGPEGTLMMPTHPARDGQTFNPKTTSSAMGVVSEVFREMPNVIRSRHPYHPVAAWGNAAETLVKNHEKSSVPDGEATPYGRLIQLKGHVLLLGCDLDTLTLLHSIEASLNLPYLRKLEMAYVDEDGKKKNLQMENVPGGHRGGVLKFEKIFKENNVMRMANIGKAVCRLVNASEAAPIMRRVMSNDPAFVLDDNPYCKDCLRFRGMVNADRVKRKQFGLHVRLPFHEDVPLDRFMRLAQSIGVRGVEVDYNKVMDLKDVVAIKKYSEKHGLEIPVLRVGPFSQYSWSSIYDIAQTLDVDYIHCTPPSQLEISEPELKSTLKILNDQVSEEGIKLLVSNKNNSFLNLPSRLINSLVSGNNQSICVSYNPLEAFRSGIKPFYEGIYSGSLRRHVAHIDVCDGIADQPENVSLGQGNSEIREILSNLCSRGYDGLLCLWPIPLFETEGVLEAGMQFWRLIEMI